VRGRADAKQEIRTGDDTMAILPTRVQDLLDFMDTHSPVWQSNQAAIGLTAAQVLAIKNGATDARAKYNAQIAAANAAKAATIDAQDAVGAARTAFADALKTIKAFALTQADPSTVYNLAQIPPPAQQSPLPPPGIPTNIAASLETDGSVTLRWKAVNPPGASGTVWTVSRKLPGEASFSFIGAAGSRIFTDETLPAGQSNVQYVVQGQRGQAVGEASAPFTVMFGHGGGGLTIAAQFTGDAPGAAGGAKLAA
jgi:hypothetical protein